MGRGTVDLRVTYNKRVRVRWSLSVTRLRLAADPEAAGREVVGGLERHRDRTHEDVALRVGVVLQLVDQVLLEGAAEADILFEVGRDSSTWKS